MLREESWPHDGGTWRAAAHQSNNLKSCLERKPHVLSMNSELGRRDPQPGPHFHALLPFCLPLSSLSLSFSSTHQRVGVLPAGDGRAHGDLGSAPVGLLSGQKRREPASAERD